MRGAGPGLAAGGQGRQEAAGRKRLTEGAAIWVRSCQGLSPLPLVFQSEKLSRRLGPPLRHCSALRCLPREGHRKGERCSLGWQNPSQAAFDGTLLGAFGPFKQSFVTARLKIPFAAWLLYLNTSDSLRFVSRGTLQQQTRKPLTSP